MVGASSWPFMNWESQTPNDNQLPNNDASHGENRLVVSPEGPEDGGDFGPKTPGTQTSGLQEAFDAAKLQRKDLYIAGGSWTLDQNDPVVYTLNETLRIPWMQDFCLEGGHYVIQYTPEQGDAVRIDSQMSCRYQFGIISSNSSGAVVRLSPETVGPDRFKVITSSKFYFNALVGGGGAWPGGEPFNSELNSAIRRIGTGLWCDGTPGSIDANAIEVTEIVGCERGLFLEGATSHQMIQATNIHLCHEHLVIGDAKDARPHGNDIHAYLNSEGIRRSVGARIFGSDNHLQLKIGQMSALNDLILESSSKGNMITAATLPHGLTTRSVDPSNRVFSADVAKWFPGSPPIPKSKQAYANAYVTPVEVRFNEPGIVSRWSIQTSSGQVQTFPGPMNPGTSLILNPGDIIAMEYEEAPGWTWRAIS